MGGVCETKGNRFLHFIPSIAERVGGTNDRQIQISTVSGIVDTDRPPLTPGEEHADNTSPMTVTFHPHEQRLTNATQFQCF